VSPLSNSGLPPEIGDYDEKRSVQAFLMWRSHGPDIDGKGRNFGLSVFMFREAHGLPEIDKMSEPDAPEWGQDRQWFWASIWEGRDFDPGHQALVYEYFTADSVDDARCFVADRIDEVAAKGLYPWAPLPIHVPEPPNRQPMTWPKPFVTCSGDVQAACWAVAAALAKRLGPEYRFVKHYPTGDSLYATLLFVTRRVPEEGVIIGLGSSIHRFGERAGRLVDAEVWDELVVGRTSVATVVDQVLRQIPSAGGHHEWADGIGLLAEIARDSALLGCDVWIDEAPDTDAEFAQVAAVFPALDSSQNRDRLWFVRGRGTGQPLVCVDLDASEVYTAADPNPLTVAGAASKWWMVLEQRVGRVRDTRLGLPVFLSKFNRKERFFVVVDAAGEGQDELHAPSLRLTEAFRQKLEATIGMPVPAHAWASIDFHLNWLHAALQWKTNPGLLHQARDRFTADGVELVSGNQEDVDLIVAWTATGGESVVVFIEAKAYSSWTNKQVGHKVPRLTAIVDSAISAGLTFTPLLVLASPTRPSQGLDVSGWPTWGHRDGRPLYLELPVAGARLGVERVDEGGRPSSSGTKWAFKQL